MLKITTQFKGRQRGAMEKKTNKNHHAHRKQKTERYKCKDTNNQNKCKQIKVQQSHRLQTAFQKNQYSTVCVLQKTQFRFKDTNRMKVKDGKINQKTKTKNITREQIFELQKFNSQV